MWCELINIIDATKAARQRVLLQAKGKEQQNRFSSLEVVESLLALPQASGVAAILFWFCVCDVIRSLSHIYIAF